MIECKVEHYLNSLYLPYTARLNGNNPHSPPLTFYLNSLYFPFTTSP